MRRTGIAMALLTMAVIGQPTGWAFDEDEPISVRRPVDQTVADMDPLATSLRHVEPGLNRVGQNTSLFVETTSSGPTPYDPLNPQVFYRVGQGFQARVERVDYVVLVDPPGGGRPQPTLNIRPRFEGEFVELIPPNTVFELTLPGDGPLPGPPTAADLLPIPDHRMNLRLDTRIDGRIDGRMDGRWHGPQTGDIPPDSPMGRPRPAPTEAD